MFLNRRIILRLELNLQGLYALPCRFWNPDPNRNSCDLFRLQDEEYRNRIASRGDRWDAMVISNRALRVSSDWVANPVVAEYSLTSDWDDRWRTGGTVDEVIEEAHLSQDHILQGIERFAREREARIRALRDAVEAAEKHE